VVTKTKLTSVEILELAEKIDENGFLAKDILFNLTDSDARKVTLKTELGRFRYGGVNGINISKIKVTSIIQAFERHEHARQAEMSRMTQ
jgi:hypothetical protein